MKTVVIGASPNPSRYAYLATMRLLDKGHEVVPVGLRKGTIAGAKIETELMPIEEVHTVTMYVGPGNQPYWYNYILSLHPKRIIFNPGTENPEFEKMATEKGIETLHSCTLVMLSTSTF